MTTKSRHSTNRNLLTRFTAIVGAVFTFSGLTLVTAMSSQATSTIFNPYVGTSITAGTTTINKGVETSVAITDLQTGATNGSDIVPVQLSVTSGSLAMSTTTNLTFTPSGTRTGSTISFKGARTDVNNALATLTYTKSSSDSVTLTAKLWDPSQDFTCATGHIYRVVNSAVTYAAAKTAATSAFSNNGYLVTPTTSTENTCVYNGIKALYSNANITWIGASSRYDSAATPAQVVYSWDGVNGGETSDFWQKDANATGTHGSAISASFGNWDQEGSIYQPNSSYSSGAIAEPCVVYYNAANNGSTWHDVGCGIQGTGKYVIEADQPQISLTSIALNFNVVAPSPSATPSPSASASASSTPAAAQPSQLALTSSTPIRDSLASAALIFIGVSLLSFSVYRNRKAAQQHN